MILVLGSHGESMITRVCDELQERGADYIHVDNADLPGSIRFTYAPGRKAELRWLNGDVLDVMKCRGIYHRMGFSSFESYEGYSDEETRFVSNECAVSLQVMLNQHPGIVVNPPRASGSNASKPYQASLFGPLGFRVPRTLVTNRPEAAAAFFEEMEGQVIYKSTSYVRSIVQRMKPEDLERLDTLTNCPLQLQEAIEGFDVRVHVVGERIFASRILAEGTDYRYDKQAEVEAWDLPSHLVAPCLDIARQLDFHLTGIDLRITPEGEAVCFEANPSPAFTWYEGRTGQPITSALCDLLIG